ncbi:hypothetical protein [Sediminitomix flava]|uniref:Uncharacterized protein n=1 Tax=Sediminitomix flava TaxID=379075 RepID=A0A315YW34_SEDFL|nr:hypothetical protein [Sediminitomix flava]PWJ34115.1 hypothetical protein BC781_11125 [Sediminitomix flava]
MKKRVAKKILKNKETLNYNKGQVAKAETVMARYERNAKAEA